MNGRPKPGAATAEGVKQMAALKFDHALDGALTGCESQECQIRKGAARSEQPEAE